MQKTKFDFEQINHMYRYQNMTAKSIGEHFGIGVKTMGKYIRDNNIIRLYNDPEWLRTRHHEMKMNLRDMAKIANCSHETVGRSMALLNIPVDLSVSNSKYKQNGEYFNQIDTQDKAYWLGFIMADGHVKTDTNKLYIALKRQDKGHLQKFLYDIKSDREVEDYEVKLDTSTSLMSRIIVSNRDFIKPLIDLGFTNDKSLKEFVPQISPNLIRHFIRGYFDGDGSFYYKFEGKQRVRVSILGGEDFLNLLSNEITDREEIHCKPRRKSNDLFELIIEGRYAELFMEWIYFNAETFLERKHKKFNDYKKQKQSV